MRLIVILFLLMAWDNLFAQDQKTYSEIKIVYGREKRHDYVEKANAIGMNHSVHLYVELGFKSDEVCVTVNDFPEQRFIVSTNSSTGFAHYLELGAIEKVRFLQIRVNHGKPVCVELEGDPKMNIMALNWVGEGLVLQFLEHYPIYD